jgi:hypothetical protein
MTFTVLQYMPLLEEEAPAHKAEMAKKTVNNANGGGDSADDGDPDSLFYHFFYSSFTTPCSGYHLFLAGNSSFYKHLLDKIQTPPPKV